LSHFLPLLKRAAFLGQLASSKKLAQAKNRTTIKQISLSQIGETHCRIDYEKLQIINYSNCFGIVWWSDVCYYHTVTVNWIFKQKVFSITLKCFIRFRQKCYNKCNSHKNNVSRNSWKKSYLYVILGWWPGQKKSFKYERERVETKGSFINDVTVLGWGSMNYWQK